MRDAFVAGQLTVLAVKVFLGVFIAICFDLLAVFRHFIKLSRPLLLLLDFLFCLVMTLIVFAILFFSNWAEIRAHVFFGLFLGGLFYYFLLHRMCRRFFVKCCLFLQKVFLFISGPAVFAGGKIAALLRFACRVLCYVSAKPAGILKSCFQRKKKE